jgi:hypothetical protein
MLALGTLLVGAASANAGEARKQGAASQLTPLLVSATNAPLAVLASDGRMHLEYDLILTNVFPTSLTLTSLDVTAADGSVCFIRVAMGCWPRCNRSPAGPRTPPQRRR